MKPIQRCLTPNSLNNNLFVTWFSTVTDNLDIFIKPRHQTMIHNPQTADHRHTLLLKLRQSRYLSYHSMSEQSSIIWGVVKRVGTRGTRKPSLAGPNHVPPLPHLHTSRNSIKKLESKVTVFRKLLKEKRETNPVVTYCICFDMDL